MAVEVTYVHSGLEAATLHWAVVESGIGVVRRLQVLVEVLAHSGLETAPLHWAVEQYPSGGVN